MLTQNQFETIPEPLVELFSNLNVKYLKLLGKRVAEIGKLDKKALDSIELLNNIGGDITTIKSELAKVLSVSNVQIGVMLNTVLKDVYQDSAPAYKARAIEQKPLKKNTQLQKTLKAVSNITQGSFKNIAKTTAFMMENENGEKVPTSLSETYRKVTDKAILTASQGFTSYTEEMRNTIRELGSQGIQQVDFASGKHKRLDSAVRQNILEGMRAMQQESEKDIGEQIGSDGWEILVHENSAPDHIDIQGKQYSLREFEVLNAGLERPIGTLNCKHGLRPIIMGVSRPLHTNAELQTIKDRNNNVFEYGGKKYTGYQATQVQRRLETMIRHAKDEQIAARAAEDEVLATEAQQKINLYAKRYKHFSEAAGLAVKKDRMSVSGYHKIKVEDLSFTPPSTTPAPPLPPTPEAPPMVPLKSSTEWVDEILEQEKKETHITQKLNSKQVVVLKDGMKSYSLEGLEFLNKYSNMVNIKSSGNSSASYTPSEGVMIYKFADVSALDQYKGIDFSSETFNHEMGHLFANKIWINANPNASIRDKIRGDISQQGFGSINGLDLSDAYQNTLSDILDEGKKYHPNPYAGTNKYLHEILGPIPTEDKEIIKKAKSAPILPEDLEWTREDFLKKGKTPVQIGYERDGKIDFYTMYWNPKKYGISDRDWGRRMLYVQEKKRLFQIETDEYNAFISDPENVKLNEAATKERERVRVATLEYAARKQAMGVITDFLGIATGNKFSPKTYSWWGHNPSYNNPSKNGVETWAEYFSAKVTNDQLTLEYMEKYLPKIKKLYDKMFKELLEYDYKG